MTPKEALEAIRKELQDGLYFPINLTPEYRLVNKALTELEELKSWRDELNETIQDLIIKTKRWEEKENKTDFEKGIARGYKTMLHQLLVGIDFDKENNKWNYK